MAQYQRDTERKKVLDETATWANSAAVNTIVLTSAVTPPAEGRGSRLHLFVRNPSTVTALNVQPQGRFADGATDRWVNLGTAQVATINTTNPSGQLFTLADGVVGTGFRLSITNATVLGVADGFSARVIAYTG